jgi:signal transduction histidine kinase
VSVRKRTGPTRPDDAVDIPVNLPGDLPVTVQGDAPLRALAVKLRQHISVGMRLCEVRADDLDATARARLDLVTQQFLHLAQLVDGEDGGRPWPSSGVDLAALVEECVDVALATRDVLLVLQIDSRTPPVEADPTLLRRAVIRVLDNAIEAAGVGGTIEVRVMPQSDAALVDVRDDGPGYGRIGSGPRHTTSVARTFAMACAGELEFSTGRGLPTRVRLHVPIHTGTAAAVP